MRDVDDFKAALRRLAGAYMRDHLAQETIDGFWAVLRDYPMLAVDRAIDEAIKRSGTDGWSYFPKPGQLRALASEFARSLYGRQPGPATTEDGLPICQVCGQATRWHQFFAGPERLISSRLVIRHLEGQRCTKLNYGHDWVEPAEQAA